MRGTNTYPPPASRFTQEHIDPMMDSIRGMGDSAKQSADHLAGRVGSMATRGVCEVVYRVVPGPLADRMSRNARRSADRSRDHGNYRKNVPRASTEQDPRIGASGHVPVPRLRNPSKRQGHKTAWELYKEDSKHMKMRQKVDRMRLAEGGMGLSHPSESHLGRAQREERLFAVKVGNLSDTVFNKNPSPLEKEQRSERAIIDWVYSTHTRVQKQHPGITPLGNVLWTFEGYYTDASSPHHHSSLQEKLQAAMSTVVNKNGTVDKSMIIKQLSMLETNGSAQVNKGVFAKLIELADGPEADFHAYLQTLDGPDKKVVSPSGTGDPTPQEAAFGHLLAQAKTARGEALMKAYLADAQEQLSSTAGNQQMRSVRAALTWLERHDGPAYRRMSFQQRLGMALDHAGRESVIEGLNQLQNVQGPKRARNDSTRGRLDLDDRANLNRAYLSNAKGVDAKPIGIGDMFAEFLEIPESETAVYLSRVEKPLGSGAEARQSVVNMIDNYVRHNSPHANRLRNAHSYKWEVYNGGYTKSQRVGGPLRRHLSKVGLMEAEGSLNALKRYQKLQSKIDRHNRRVRRQATGQDLYGRRLDSRANERARLSDRLRDKHRRYRSQHPPYGPNNGPWTSGGGPRRRNQPPPPPFTPPPRPRPRPSPNQPPNTPPPRPRPRPRPRGSQPPPPPRPRTRSRYQNPPNRGPAPNQPPPQPPPRPYTQADRDAAQERVRQDRERQRQELEAKRRAQIDKIPDPRIRDIVSRSPQTYEKDVSVQGVANVVSEVLNGSSGQTDKQAYRRLSILWHPDLTKELEATAKENLFALTQLYDAKTQSFKFPRS